MATVSGYVEKIKYRNEENGYSILSVNSDGLDYVLVGTFPYISEGDFIEASGRDVEHPIYGDQIQVESYELKAPEDTASMERYSGSNMIFPFSSFTRPLCLGMPNFSGRSRQIPSASLRKNRSVWQR